MRRPTGKSRLFVSYHTCQLDLLCRVLHRHEELELSGASDGATLSNRHTMAIAVSRARFSLDRVGVVTGWADMPAPTAVCIISRTKPSRGD